MLGSHYLFFSLSETLSGPFVTECTFSFRPLAPREAGLRPRFFMPRWLLFQATLDFKMFKVKLEESTPWVSMVLYFSPSSMTSDSLDLISNEVK